jgi:predicted transcriptional regulator
MKLSNEFKVALEIYKAESNDEAIWFTRIVERLSGDLDKITISNALDTLTDWGIVSGYYGSTRTRKPAYCYCYTITEHHRSRMKDLYECNERIERNILTISRSR